MGSRIGRLITGSLTENLEMKFTRRPDLDARTRLHLALMVSFKGFSNWGIVSELAAKFGVSRQFLYDNLARCLRLQADGGVDSIFNADYEFLHRLMLCMRLHCNSPVGGIVETLAEMGLHPGSAGHVSEFLEETAAACKIEIPRNAKPVILMLDEIFANGRPLFVVMEASSHYILDILLAADRKGETWEAELSRLQEQGVDISLLVKDQGVGLGAAAKTLGLPERTDLFHLLRHFDPFLPSLERHAYGAIVEESERRRTFDNRQTEKVLETFLLKYEESTVKAVNAIQNFDAYDYLHKCLHEAFDSFTASGQLRTRKIAEGDVEAALSLMEELFKVNGGILAAVKFLRKNLDDYWSYFDQLEDLVRHHTGTMPDNILRTACLAWQSGKKSMAVKTPQQKKELARLSGECMQFVMTGAGTGLKTNVQALLDSLEANIRSSSPLEAVNSVIRSSLNSCRGQVTQEALTMLAFHINHKRATRGKYKGTSPYERLTGKTVRESSIELLMRLSLDARKRKTEVAGNAVDQIAA